MLPGPSDSWAEFLNGPPLAFLDGRRHPTREYCPSHSHPGLEIVLHVSGSGTTTFDHGGELAFSPDSVVIYPPHVDHDQRMRRLGEDACILIGLERALPEALASCWQVSVLTDEPLRQELLALSRAGTDNPLSRVTLSHRATAVLGRLAELTEPFSVAPVPPSPAIQHADRARAYIDANFANIERVEDIADVLELSPDHLRHLFRQRFDATLIGYLTSVRLVHAKSLLRRSTLPLKAIATECGFQNERYFSEVFKKEAGMSPGSFRRL